MASVSWGRIGVVPSGYSSRDLVWSAALSKWLARGKLVSGHLELLQSADGITWEPLVTTVPAAASAVAATDAATSLGQVVVLTSGGIYELSQDPDPVWTLRTADLPGTYSQLLYHSGTGYVLYGTRLGNASVWLSADGITWSFAENLPATLSTPQRIPDGGAAGLMLCGGSSSVALLQSADGNSWNLRALPAFFSIATLDWSTAAGKWLGWGYLHPTDPTPHHHLYAGNIDGTTWEDLGLAPWGDDTNYGILENPASGLLVAFNFSSTWVSADGETWKSIGKAGPVDIINSIGTDGQTILIGLSTTPNTVVELRGIGEGDDVGLPPGTTEGTLDDIAPPTDLVAVFSASTASNDLTWVDHATNEVGFLIEASMSADGPWAVVARVPVVDLTSWSDLGIAELSHVYRYRVRAYNATHYSTPSNIATLAPNTPPDLKVGPVIDAGPGGRARGPLPSTVLLVGSLIDAEGLVHSFRWTQTGGPAPAEIVTPGAPETAVVFTTFVPGRYTFQLRGLLSNSEISDTATVIVPDPRAPIIENLRLNSLSEDPVIS